MASRFFQFRILLWKNWKVCCPTIFSLVKYYGCSVFILISFIIMRTRIAKDSYDDTTYTPFKLSMPILSEKQGHSLKHLIYSPWSPTLEKVMTDVCNSIATDEGVPMGNYALEDKETLDNYLSNEINMNSTLAGIRFDDALQNASHLPPRLNVTFRFPGQLRLASLTDSDGTEGLFAGIHGVPSWKTHKVFLDQDVLGPRARKNNEGALPSYHNEGFLKLQQVVAYSVMKQWKQQVHNQSFTLNGTALVMQRYPHPAWTVDKCRTLLKPTLGTTLATMVFSCYMVSIMMSILAEKDAQLKETMKSMGLPNWLHWLTWFTTAFLATIVVMILTVIILKVDMAGNAAILGRTNGVLFLLFLVCYALAQITFCFALSAFFTKPIVCELIYTLSLVLILVMYVLLNQRYATSSLAQKLLPTLYFQMGLCWGCEMALEYELQDEGLQWNNLWKSPYRQDRNSVGAICLMLILDAVVYMLLTLYIEQVFPGKYGVPQPWYFPFQKTFWCPRRYAENVEAGQHIVTLSEFHEKDPENLQKGIEIQHLRKQYPGKLAVNDLSLNIYKDQITVLLGHNGAGKSTTMAMLTGITFPTSGTAFVSGYDIRTSIDKARESMGFCPQEDILFMKLTVRNNLYFFTALKGIPRKEVEVQVDYYLRLLELKGKEKEIAKKLSGGMKRKLCLAIALSGGSTVVMLDEPTSGMDPVARRNVWTILQKEKKGRSILLSTHAMDEADVLGDRIAIMAHGKLECCGSPFFLKKKYSAGDHLILEVSPYCRVGEVTRELRQYIPGIEIDNHAGSELSYVLSDEYRSTFSAMLQDIESKKKALEVLNFGITCTTLEEVFLKVGSGQGLEKYKKPKREDNLDNSSDILLYLDTEKLGGCSLMLSRFAAILLKKSMMCRHSWITCVVQIFLPALLLVISWVIDREMPELGDPSVLPSLRVSLDSYDDPITAMSYDRVSNRTQHYAAFLAESGKRIADWGRTSFSTKVMEETNRSTHYTRSHYIVGASFRKDVVTAWFNNDPLHSPPLSLQLAINSIIREEISAHHHIEFYNHPLPVEEKKGNAAVTSRAEGVLSYFYMTFLAVSLLLTFPYIQERVKKAKHLQFLSGISVITFWSASFLFDLLLHTLGCVVNILVLTIIKLDNLSETEQLGAFFLLMLNYGLSTIPLIYVVALYIDSPGYGYLMIMFYSIAPGLINPIIGAWSKDVKKYVEWIALIVPYFAFNFGCANIQTVTETNKRCSKMLKACLEYGLAETRQHRLTQRQCDEQVCNHFEDCCGGGIYMYDWKPPGIGRPLCLLYLSSIIHILLLLISEYGFLEVPGKSENPSYIQELDDDVMEEKNKVENITEADRRKYAIVMQNVSKHFGKFVAVNSLSLTIKRRECFGLLGFNGAGKSTTFKMLTGEINPSSGNIWVNSLNTKSKRNKINPQTGYCPQEHALLEDLTCRESLLVFGLLRGLRKRDANVLAEDLARRMDFEEHLDKVAGHLSGGCKRKLNTAIALVGDPGILYLDEPTTGMDPGAKRHIWDAFSSIRETGKCIVLTSHSMDECEALCTRLAIMVNGVFVCLGTLQHLKSKFSSGYTLTVRLKEGSDVQKVKTFVFRSFPNCSVSDSYQNMIYFAINDRYFSWARAYDILENNKEEVGIEDYSLSQSSLEQIFLSFAKQQRFV